MVLLQWEFTGAEEYEPPVKQATAAPSPESGGYDAPSQFDRGSGPKPELLFILFCCQADSLLSGWEAIRVTQSDGLGLQSTKDRVAPQSGSITQMLLRYSSSCTGGSPWHTMNLNWGNE